MYSLMLSFKVFLCYTLCIPWQSQEVHLKTLELQYLEHPNLVLRFLELEAIVKFTYEGKLSLFAKEHEQLYQRSFYWRQSFNEAKRPDYIALNKSLNNGEIECLEDFYAALSKLSKPKIKGKALRDKKKRSGQEAYQREQLGDGFIDNPPLISAAKSAALALADDDAGEDEIAAKALELASEHPCDDPLTDDQMKTLNKVIADQIAKHLKLDRIEAKILDEGNKNLYFMYGKIKCKAAVGDTIELGMKSAVELCKCSRSDVKPILNKLAKLGFIYCIQKGKQGRHTGRASVYRRIA